MVQWKRTELVFMRMQVQSLSLLSGSEIWHCCELWCKLQMQLGSCVAVAVAGSYSSDLTPSLGTSIYRGEALKKKRNNYWLHSSSHIASVNINSPENATPSLSSQGPLD